MTSSAGGALSVRIDEMKMNTNNNKRESEEVSKEDKAQREALRKVYEIILSWHRSKPKNKKSSDENGESKNENQSK